MTRNKNCPGCGFPYDYRRFWTLHTRYFECPECGTRLTTSLTFVIWPALLSAPFMAVPMGLGLTHNHWWWALLPVWAVIHFFLYYFFLDIRFHKAPVSCRESQGKDTAAGRQSP